MGSSDLVISDIEDAIRFAIENGNADQNEVHMIGGSGGGYATMLLFMRLIEGGHEIFVPQALSLIPLNRKTSRQSLILVFLPIQVKPEEKQKYGYQ